jgi:hypothetical protein
MGRNPLIRTSALLVLLLVGVIATQASNAQAAADDGAAAEATMFPKGTWTFEFYGNYFQSYQESDNLGSAVAAGGYYFGDRHAIRAEVVGYGLDNEEDPGPDCDDTFATGVNVGLRYHFYERDRTTLFVEGLAGLFYGLRNFPAGGTHFNFNEQLGVGATYRLQDNCHVMGGVRYMHISNAQIRGQDENPSFNGLGGFVGVLFRY